jgi:hypothetical protein
MSTLDFRSKLPKWQFGNKIIISYLLLFAILCFILGVFINFYLSENDFWVYFHISRNMDFRNLGTLYDGFYPIGYPIFLHIFLNANPIIFAFITNIIFGLILIGAAAYFGVRILGYELGLVYILALTLNPHIFTWINSPTGDIGGAAFATLGGILILCGVNNEDEEMKAALLYAIGLLFGLAALCRYHYLPLGFAFFFASSLLSKRKVRHMAICVFGFLTLYSLQMLVNYLSGHGPLETYSYFNLFMAMNHWPWYHIPSNIPTSMLGVILEDPVKFFALYKDALAIYLPFAVPSIACIIILKDKTHIRINLVMAISVLLYICIIALGGGSPRGTIPVVPYFLLSIFMIAKYGFKSFREIMCKNNLLVSIVSATLLFYILLVSMIWIGDDLTLILKAKIQSNKIAAVENILIEKEKISTPMQVACTSFNIYLPNLKPYTFFPIRGGSLDYNPNGKRRFPKISKESIELFVRDCRRNNISHLILANNAEKVMEEFRALYYGEKSYDDLKFIADVGGLKIYRIKSE